MEVIGVSKAQNIFDFIFDSQLLPVQVLKTQKNAVFWFISVKKGPNDMKTWETFGSLHKLFFVWHFWLILVKFL